MKNVYEHKAQYYETDQMGIVHHSNYVRWMEEARCDFMNKTGFSYARMEELGIISPVIKIECEYKSMTHFEDTIVIESEITRYTGVKMEVEYTMYDKATKEVRVTAKSSHCFLNKEGHPISLKKTCPEGDKMFQSALG